MKKNIFIIVVLLGLLSWGVYDFFMDQEEAIPVNMESVTIGLEKGNLAPDFNLNTTDGESLKLSDYRGKKVLLNFWASWCPPCRAEMPHMEDFYKKKKDDGVIIIAVNLTNMERNEESIKTFIEEFGLTFPIPLDVDGKIGNEYHAFTIPTSYIIDSNGLVQHKIIGPMSYEMMENYTNNMN